MKNSIKFFFFLLLLTTNTVGFSQKPTSEDEKRVRAAVLDYVEGSIYDQNYQAIKAGLANSVKNLRTE